MDYKEQKIICDKYSSLFCESPSFLKIGISLNFKDGIWPINGLRHPLKGDATGWYIWAGEEFPVGEDAFVPLHVEHLKECCPIVLKYLGLAPGWRFLLADGYEDVWEDLSLLQLD